MDTGHGKQSMVKRKSDKVMDEYFPGFYVGQEDLQAFQQNALIVVDAYLLLDLFRISEGKKFIELLQQDNIKVKLWLPYDAVWLYHQLMHSVLMEQIDKVKSTLFYLAQFKQNLDDEYTHPYVKDRLMIRTNRLIKDLKKALSRESKDLANALQNQADSIPSFINALYPKNNIGDEYGKTELKQLFEEASERYIQETPPGYLYDNACKNSRVKYHDYIIWNEIQRCAKAKNKDIIFVTNRIRPDWFFIYDDKVIGPRKELMNEFKKETQRSIYIITAHYFVDKNIKVERYNEYNRLLKQLPETPVYGYATQRTEKEQSHIGYEFVNTIG